MSTDAIVGFVFGLLSGVISNVVLYLLQAQRDGRIELLKQRREDIRLARDWAQEGKKASLRGFDLAGANLSGKDLAGADLEDANLEGAHLWGTDLTGANLRRANFRKARMVGVLLNGANLLMADFSGARLVDTDLSGAEMHRTKLRRVRRIEHCIWTGAMIDETTELPVASVLARSPRFRALLARSKESIRQGGGLSPDAFWKAVAESAPEEYEAKRGAGEQE